MQNRILMTRAIYSEVFKRIFIKYLFFDKYKHSYEFIVRKNDIFSIYLKSTLSHSLNLIYVNEMLWFRSDVFY